MFVQDVDCNIIDVKARMITKIDNDYKCKSVDLGSCIKGQRNENLEPNKDVLIKCSS